MSVKKSNKRIRVTRCSVTSQNDAKNDQHEHQVKIYTVTRKATGFKSLRLKCREINQATPKCQIDFWTKFAKKV